MYAIVEIFGHQLRVSEGDEVQVENGNGADMEVGAQISFDKVFACSDGEELRVGRPLLAGCSVTGKLLALRGGEKLRVVHFRRRERYRKRTGYRRHMCRIRIEKINVA